MCGGEKELIVTGYEVLRMAEKSNKTDDVPGSATLKQLMTGYQVARALLAADELRLVDLLRDGPKSLAEIANETGTHGPTLKRFMRILQISNIIKEREDEVFLLGPMAEGLSEAARGGVESYQAWSNILYTLRTGKPSFENMFGKQFYEHLGEDPGRVERWDNAMISVSKEWISAFLEVYDFTGVGSLADLAGGRGTFISKVLTLYPTMRGILLDRPHVIAMAESVVEAAGVRDRCRLVGGSFIETVPSGADTYTICNALVDWDENQVLKIFMNCRQAMDKGGKLLVVDRLLPGSDHPDFEEMIFLDLFFLVLFGGGLRAVNTYKKLFTRASFRVERIAPIGQQFSLMESTAI